MNNSTQNISNVDRLTKLSLLSVTITAIITSVHHLYRFGFVLIIPAVIVIFLPTVLLSWFRNTKNKMALLGYGLYNLLVIGWLGIVDGGLDHTVKALGGKMDIRMLPPSDLVGGSIL